MMKRRIQSWVTKSRPLKPLGNYLAGRGVCLTYHRVLAGNRRDRGGPDSYCPNLELAVSVEDFERQMEWLSANYRCLSVPEAVKLLEHGKLPGDTALVTFDDGYRDNLQYALPVLRKYGVPATIYVTTGLVDGMVFPWWDELGNLIGILPRAELEWRGRRYSFDLTGPESQRNAFQVLGQIYRREDRQGELRLLGQLREQARAAGVSVDRRAAEILSWDEVAVLAKEPLITLGSHTHNHYRLSSLTELALDRELTESRRILEQRLGRPVQHLAYPFGGVWEAQKREFESARRAGYASAFTTRPGHLHNGLGGRMHALPRIFISYFDDLERIQWKLSGFSAGFWQLRERLGAWR